MTVILTEVLGKAGATSPDVLAAGLQLLVIIYGGKPDETLNHLRYCRYMSMIASCMTPNASRLTPTENAAKYHIYRAHCQVVFWSTLGYVRLNPEEWGWSLVEGCFMPISTDLPPAPENLLKIIRC